MWHAILRNLPISVVVSLAVGACIGLLAFWFAADRIAERPAGTTEARPPLDLPASPPPPIAERPFEQVPPPRAIEDIIRPIIERDAPPVIVAARPPAPGSRPSTPPSSAGGWMPSIENSFATPSARHVFAASDVEEIVGRPNFALLDFVTGLNARLRAHGYTNTTFQRVENVGILAMTRRERLSAQGFGAAPADRWSKSPSRPQVSGLRSYWDALVKPHEDRFRYVALFFSPNEPRVNRGSAEEEWVDQLYRQGWSELSTEDFPNTADVSRWRLHALIYEFRQGRYEREFTILTDRDELGHLRAMGLIGGSR